MSICLICFWQHKQRGESKECTSAVLMIRGALGQKWYWEPFLLKKWVDEQKSFSLLEKAPNFRNRNGGAPRQLRPLRHRWGHSLLAYKLPSPSSKLSSSMGMIRFCLGFLRLVLQKRRQIWKLLLKKCQNYPPWIFGITPCKKIDVNTYGP